MYGCKALSLSLREEHKLKKVKSRVPRKIFGSERDEVTGEWIRLHNEKINACISHQISFRWWSWEEWDGRGMQHVWGRGEMHIGFWSEYLRERKHLEDIGVDGRIMLKRTYEVEWVRMDWIDLDQDRERWWTFVNAVVSLRGPQNAGNFLTSWGPVSSLGRTMLHRVS